MRILSFVIITCILFGAVSLNYAQKKDEVVHEKPDVPIDASTNKITYTKVVNTSGTTSELYQKGLRWFNSFYKNPSNVIREKDESKGKIVGKIREIQDQSKKLKCAKEDTQVAISIDGPTIGKHIAEDETLYVRLTKNEIETLKELDKSADLIDEYMKILRGR